MNDRDMCRQKLIRSRGDFRELLLSNVRSNSKNFRISIVSAQKISSVRKLRLALIDAMTSFEMSFASNRMPVAREFPRR